ncbi:hypothetical protein Patl1_33889 [Pistacia atlantica]|uniref:Uncharacterized protein n=1 Tax=Pistacia atlantica TaxID=434234 RepID=A0ACC0ZSM5_9ROSI|nr:hypothetical protein Patl1_33889 [Pistacia atlantica]
MPWLLQISFVFLLHLSIGITLSNGQRCYDTGNFTTNSVYGKNRDLILSNLASNVSTNGGFYTATIGQDTDEVYALALCRGDSSSETCFSCVNTTIHDLITKCPNQKEAISWAAGPRCTVRYADRSFIGLLETDPSDAGYNVNNITTNLTQFDQTWESLMDRVVTKASMGSFKLKFATEEVNLTFFQKIYALMQCTPDLSRSNCDSCLRQSVSYFETCCHGKQGGYVLRPSCIFPGICIPFMNQLKLHLHLRLLHYHPEFLLHR